MGVTAGQEVDYIAQFRRARDAHFSEIIVDTNRVINRLEKVLQPHGGVLIDAHLINLL